jgi:transketolase
MTTTITTPHDTDTVAINTIRALCMDAIQRANSGHPGTPMDIAPLAYTLWQRFLRFDPADPIWPNRDRFVLSEGHASALLWSLLHLTGVQAVDPDYEVLPPSVKARVAVEKASTLGWDRFVGDGGAVIGMHTFGSSAPLKELLTKFGFTPEKVAERARECLAAARHQ